MDRKERRESMRSTQQAFAVQGDKFIAVGTNDQVKKLAGKGEGLTPSLQHEAARRVLRLS